MLYFAAALFFLPMAVAAWGFANVAADTWHDDEDPSQSEAEGV
ncbi:MAG TPA: hypothetical protein VGV09_09430 [Steroidobacteraceae bacterium]|nr:hypothetical protein [Steroidobacteraceae bacterium]